MDYSKLWVAWLALFLVIEGAAILNSKKGDTLSEHVWRWIPYKSARWVALGGFLAWLAYHFLLDNPY